MRSKDSRGWYVTDDRYIMCLDRPNPRFLKSGKEMNMRGEFREAFRQYRRRLGIPLTCPNAEIRVGELCFFNVDGTVVSLGNCLEGEMEEKLVTRTVDHDTDPIISNGMRCRTLSDVERVGYALTSISLTLVMNSLITASIKHTFSLAKSSTYPTTPSSLRLS